MSFIDNLKMLLSLAEDYLSNLLPANVMSSLSSFFDEAKYNLNPTGRFGFGEGEKCSLKFCMAKDSGFHLLETPLSEDQQVKEHDDHFRISATVIDSKLLEKWLRGFGEQVWDISSEKILHHKNEFIQNILKQSLILCVPLQIYLD